MSELERVSFKKGREHQQRLSQPYVPGKRHSKYWTEAENNILKEIYPRRGSIACLAKLGNHRSQLSVYVQAQKLGLTAPKDEHSRLSPPMAGGLAPIARPQVRPVRQAGARKQQRRAPGSKRPT
jgi:hypothetical protein